jgi:hypothetical protein
MKFTSLIAASLATAVSAAEERSSAWAFGWCPWVQKTEFSENDTDYNNAALLGNWFQVQKPNNVPFESTTKYGCLSGQITSRPKAWVYDIGLNFGALNLETNELWNMYNDESKGVDNSWLRARTDINGNLWAQAKMMPEVKMQVLYNSDDLLVLHSCADMMAVHWSGAIVYARQNFITDAQRLIVNEVVDRLVPEDEYTSADLMDNYHASDCRYNW